MENGSKGKKALKIILAVLMILIIASAVFVVYRVYSIKNSLSPVGYWVVTTAEYNDVTMTAEDADAMGYNGIGSFTLKKSGECEVTLMGKDYTGTWKKKKSRSLTIDCGEGCRITAEIKDEDGPVMEATAENYIEYRLEK